MTNIGDARPPEVRVALSTPTAGRDGHAASRVVRNMVAKGATKLSREPDDQPGSRATRSASRSPVGEGHVRRRLVADDAARSVPTGQPSATVQDFAYTGPAVAIPDADATGASVPLDVSRRRAGEQVTFSVDGTECTPTARDDGGHRPHVRQRPGRDC